MDPQTVTAPQVWVDADACPVVVREILFRAARRTGIAVTLVANQPLSVPRLSQIRSVQVQQGFDVADDYIAERIRAGDIVISADIPLASDVIEKGGVVLSPRGELMTTENIRERLNMRDFMDTLRGSGVATGGPPPLNQTDRRNFASQLDRLLAKIDRAG